MSNLRGSTWAKWDLHVHTPASLVHKYSGADPWEAFLQGLETLPKEFKVIGINDYLFLDGYKKVLEAKNNGRLANIELFLPVIELRLDKFGGSNNHLSRVNYHVLFSDELSPETIEHQFLNALSSKYALSPPYSSLTKDWGGVPTRQGLEDLGRAIIESVPAQERHKFNAPLIEGFNNLCLSFDSIQSLLNSHYFQGKTITAVGKTEWADIKWNDQSIADKRTIINRADFVFISAESVDAWRKSKESLTNATVNDRLLDCSDSHSFSDANTTNRLGKCFTWIKADPTFEGLRQALFEYSGRVKVSNNPPIEPLLDIREVKLNFPTTTKVQSNNGSEVFCFRGDTSISFSPYLTCIIGGRGTGKSTLLNLLHEKLNPGTTKFFKDNHLTPELEANIQSCVIIDNDFEEKDVEFLQQNEIEQLATAPSRLTQAILSRLAKRDEKGLLMLIKTQIYAAIESATRQIERLKTEQALIKNLSASEKELATKKSLIDSIHNDQYGAINSKLALINKEIEELRNGKSRLDGFVRELRTIMSKYSLLTETPTNIYESQLSMIVLAIEEAISGQQGQPAISAAEAREKALAISVVELKRQLDGFLKERGLSQENLQDIGKASERVAQLEAKLPEMRAAVNAIKTEISQFTSQNSLSDKYATTVLELLNPINLELHNLSTEVKPIALKYEFDENSFREAIIRRLKEEVAQDGRSIRIDHLTQILENLDLLALTSLDKILSRLNDDKETGRILRDYFSKEPNFKTFKLEVEKERLNIEQHGRIRVSYDTRPIENTSFGQRCTAAIVILLLLGNTPIVIDEPEAHLDSALIAKYLVELVKRVKNDRQVIFATHNANFVVNGDAELVHCFTMADEKVTEITSTTIENLAHRHHLSRIPQ